MTGTEVLPELSRRVAFPPSKVPELRTDYPNLADLNGTEISEIADVQKHLATEGEEFQARILELSLLQEKYRAFLSPSNAKHDLVSANQAASEGLGLARKFFEEYNLKVEELKGEDSNTRLTVSSEHRNEMGTQIVEWSMRLFDVQSIASGPALPGCVLNEATVIAKSLTESHRSMPTTLLREELCARWQEVAVHHRPSGYSPNSTWRLKAVSEQIELLEFNREHAPAKFFEAKVQLGMVIQESIDLNPKGIDRHYLPYDLREDSLEVALAKVNAELSGEDREGKASKLELVSRRKIVEGIIGLKLHAADLQNELKEAQKAKANGTLNQDDVRQLIDEVNITLSSLRLLDPVAARYGQFFSDGLKFLR